MAIGKKLTTETQGYGVLAILLVLFMIVLNKFKTSNVGSMTCASGTTLNVTLNKCCAGNCLVANQTAIKTAASTVDTFITGLSEPASWVAIIVIALVGFGIIKYVKSKK